MGASDGASDYANKFGEPLVAGFARSYPATTTAMRSAGGGGDEPSYEFVKPIMFSAGLGTVRDQHLLKHDGSHQQHPPPADLAVVKVSRHTQHGQGTKEGLPAALSSFLLPVCAMWVCIGGRPSVPCGPRWRRRVQPGGRCQWPGRGGGGARDQCRAERGPGGRQQGGGGTS